MLGKVLGGLRWPNKLLAAAATLGLWLWLAGSPALAVPATPATRFRQANEALYRGDARAAIHVYQGLLAAGIDDADLSFNLALALHADGQLGAARWALEQARRQRSGDEGIERARRRLQTQLCGAASPPVADAATPPRLPSELPWVLDAAATFRSDTFAWLLLLGMAAGCLLLALRPWLRKQRWLGGATALAMLAALVALLGGTGLALQSPKLTGGPAAVVLQDAALRSGPDPRAGQRAALCEGSVVRSGAQLGGYTEVQLHPARKSLPTRGWVPSQSLKRLDG